MKTKFLRNVVLSTTALCMVAAPLFVMSQTTSSDINQDTCVNKYDLNILVQNFMRRFRSQGDIDGDGKIDINDFSYIMRDFEEGCISEILPPNDPTGSHELKITHDGIERNYTVFVPGTYNAGTPMPILFALHGGGNIVPLSSLNIDAAIKKFIAVYPTAVNQQWNDGRAHTAEDSGDADDVGLMQAILTKLHEQLSIDASQEYLIGVSNGGIMTMRVMCDQGDTFDAYASIIANLAEEYEPLCTPTTMAPYVLFNSVDDPLMPWEGGELQSGLGFPLGHGRVLSIPDTVTFWVNEHQCETGPTIVELPDVDPNDGTRVYTESYTDCTNGSDITLFRVEGGGHTWPGGFQYAPEAIIGKTSKDIDATNELWNFFQAHR